MLAKIILFFIIFFSTIQSIAHENDLILDCKLTELFDKERNFKMKVNFDSIVNIKFDYDNNNKKIIILDNTKLVGKTFEGLNSDNKFTANYIGKYNIDTKLLIDRSNGLYKREGFDDSGDLFYVFTGKCKKIERLF